MSPNGVLAGAHVIAQNSPLAISLLRSREGLYRGAWRMTRQSVFCVLCSCFGVGVVVSCVFKDRRQKSAVRSETTNGWF